MALKFALFASITLFLFVGSINSISCYSYNEYTDSPGVIHDVKFCTSTYMFNGDAAFTGRNTLRNMDFEENECALREMRWSNDQVDGHFECICTSDLCNYPLTFKEVIHRNFTIKPIFNTHKLL
uniref:Activin_recp domain-containing protein n=1 Tax=Caenorhabditis tropicalis TaxID=1561998 RepID=A0A1I7TRJ5_9PELO